ncbi:MAG TPA: M48 family metallopeptidase [Gemmataceae bacterium]|nr:M48 family metallopeptidase [Gemmataceae bacterium]
MARTPSFYPPSPDNVPADLTRVRGEYRARVFLLLSLVALFFLLYFGLLVGSAYLVYWGCAMPVRRSMAGLDVTLKIVLPLFGLVVFLFLLKGFFKRRGSSRRLDVEITAEEQPRLFRFLEELCEETGAAMPHRVFVNFEVNAAASYKSSILSLLWPTSRKNLLIGLGLVNVLNLTEFKAVMAHEFGHFGQKAMRLNGYVYLASRIIDDMLFGRDALDEMLERARKSDSGAAIPAWVLYGITWALGKLFFGVFYGVILLHKAMRREAEFHADLVAVSVAGSDAMVHSLKRSCFGDATMMQALSALALMAEQQCYTGDVFLHHSHAANHVRRLAKNPFLGEPPPLPADPRQPIRVFDPKEEENYPVMWLDHPPNYQRERNAKARYIRTAFDERSAWILFDNVADLRLRATYRMYRVHFRVRKDVELTEPADVQEMIDAEYKELTYDPRYHGVYDNRNIEPGTVPALVAEVIARPWSNEQLAAAYEKLYDDALKERVVRYETRQQEVLLLDDIVQQRAPLERGTFMFRGERYRQRQAKQWLEVVSQELDADYQQLCALDRKVFVVHYQMAEQLGKEVVEELLARYRFHLAVQEIWKSLQRQRGPVQGALRLLAGAAGPNMDEMTFVAVRELLRQAHQVLLQCVRTSRELLLPELQNIEAGTPLSRFLLDKDLVGSLSAYDFRIKGTWINKFLKQFLQVHARTNRIHFKSLGGLLALQEKVARRSLKRWKATPKVTGKD